MSPAAPTSHVLDPGDEPPPYDFVQGGTAGQPAIKVLNYGLLTFLIALPAMVLIYNWVI